MFIKAFKTKSNTQIKSTERKKIRSKVESAFGIHEDDLNKLLPSKCSLNHLKLITHSGQTVSVYTCDKRPLFFEVPFDETQLDKTVLVPTVYALWILPELVPVFTTHAAVLPRLAAGADLMLPGIIRQGDGYTTYGSHKKDAIVAVNLTSNRSAVGVGMLAKSSADLYLARNAGIGVKILHVFGDKLWNLEPSVTLQLPNAGATMKAPSLEEFPSLGDSFKPKKEQRVAQADASTLDVRLQENASDRETNDLETKFDNVEIADDSRNHGDDRNNDGDESDDDDTEKPPSEDEKLKQAFLTAIKKMGKNPAVPLLTSNFYRCHILTVDSTIDIKHTSYKKLSKFLQEMAARNYLTVKEETKGVEKIVAFNTSHPDIVNVVLSVGEAPSNGQSTTSGGDGLFITEMKEVYIVTRDVMHFFNAFDVKCGEGLEPAQVKKYVKEYVCKHKLQDPTNIRTIRIDDVLKALCGTDEATKTIPFEELLMHVTNKMEHKYAMCNRNELKTGGKTSTIKMTLAKRSGNKTVTLIDHLEMFGIRLPEFAQACKIGVAASTSIIRPDCPANANKGQLLVQGNQIRFVYKLLTETYKIPPKYINGMELAKKEKKAKKK